MLVATSITGLYSCIQTGAINTGLSTGNYLANHATLQRKNIESDKHTTGRFNALCVDPAAVIGYQRGYDITDIVREPDTTEGCLRGNESINLLVISNPPATEIGFDGSRRQDVNSNAAY